MYSSLYPSVLSIYENKPLSAILPVAWILPEIVQDEVSEVNLSKISSYMQMRNREIDLSTLKSLFAYPNSKVSWDNCLPPRIYNICSADVTESMRKGLKRARKCLARPVIKGGKRNHKMWPNKMLELIELVQNELGRDPLVCELPNYIISNNQIKPEDCIFDFDFNEELRPGDTPNSCFLHYCKEIENLCELHGSKIYKSDSLSPTRDWLTNIDIDKILSNYTHSADGSLTNNSYILPTQLSTMIETFAEMVRSNNNKYRFIGCVINTSSNPPGEHWICIGANMEKEILSLYCSCNYQVITDITYVLYQLARELKFTIEMSMVRSQWGASDCGIYSTIRLISLIYGNDNYLMYSSVPDFEIYEYRKKFYELLYGK